MLQVAMTKAQIKMTTSTVFKYLPPKKKLINDKCQEPYYHYNKLL